MGGINTWTPNRPDATIYFDDISALRNHYKLECGEKNILSYDDDDHLDQLPVPVA